MWEEGKKASILSSLTLLLVLNSFSSTLLKNVTVIVVSWLILGGYAVTNTDVDIGGVTNDGIKMTVSVFQHFPLCSRKEVLLNLFIFFCLKQTAMTTKKLKVNLAGTV